VRELDLAYVAGFLDGDGAIMAEIETRTDLRQGVRVRITVHFAQSSSHEHVLEHIRAVLGLDGTIIRDKRSGSSYRLRNQAVVERLLRALQPHVVAKREQVALALQVLATQDMSERLAAARRIAALNMRSRHFQREAAIPPVTTSDGNVRDGVHCREDGKSADAIIRWQPDHPG
jgi:hypothetical protein